MAKNKSTTFLQLLTSLTRPFAYSIAITNIGKIGESESLFLLIVGYIPLFSILDVAIQSYTRWSYTKLQGYTSSFKAKKTLIVILTTSVCALIYSSNNNHSATAYISFILIYFINSYIFYYESHISTNFAITIACSLELIGSSILILLNLIYKLDWALYLILCIFPICRITSLIVSATLTQGENNKNRTILSSSKFIFYSVTSQILAATGSSLPSIFAQISNKFENLEDGLVAFRIMLSSASILSITINALGSRIFYGTIGSGWRPIEEKILYTIQKLKITVYITTIGTPIILLNTQMTNTTYIFIIILVTPILSVLNLLSSISISKGLPFTSFQCQLSFLLSSFGVCAAIYGYKVASILCLSINSIYILIFFKNIVAKNNHQQIN